MDKMNEGLAALVGAEAKEVALTTDAIRGAYGFTDLQCEAFIVGFLQGRRRDLLRTDSPGRDMRSLCELIVSRQTRVSALAKVLLDE